LARAIPEWVVVDDGIHGVTDVELRLLATGKEAEVSVVERTGPDGRTCLLANKRYRPRKINHKGELQELGFERAPTFRNDHLYRDGRRYTRFSRDQRAIEKMTAYGKSLLAEKWPGHEFDMLSRAWEAGASVPYPVENRHDGMLMQYIGAVDGAAPRVAQARLDRKTVARAWDQLVDNVRTMLEVGIVHSDLSPYNMLWWDDQLWIIDLPQAVDIGQSPHGFEFLHRDILNVGKWFGRNGVDVDPDALFAELLSVSFPMR